MLKNLEIRIAPIAIFLVFLSAIPFGANRPWAWILFGIVTFVLLCTQCVADFLNRDTAQKAFKRLGLIPWLSLIVLTWMLYQSSGLPPEFLHHPIHFDVPADIRHESAISLIPERGYQYALRFSIYIGLFWIVYRFARTSSNARKALNWITFGYAVMSLYAFFTLVTGLYKTHVLWFTHPWSGVAPSGTFVNQNHFAAFMALGALTIGAQVINQYLSMEFRNINDRNTARKLMARELRQPAFLAKAAIFIATALCVLQAQSIAASTSFLIALAALILLCIRPRFVKSSLVFLQRLGTKGAALAIIAIGAAGLALLVIVGNNLIESTDPLRVGIYQNIATAIWNNAWLGTGSGTFAEAFAPYKGMIGANHIIDNAHNSFFQNMVELGLVGATILYFGLALILARLLFGIASRRSGRSFPAAGIATALYASLHSLLDFSFELPAIAAMFAVILAVSTAQADPSRKRKAGKST